MKITIFCDVALENEGQITQMAGCGIILLAEEGTQSKKRTMSFGLGGSDRELANIQVVRLALMSVLPPFRKVPIFLHVTDRIAIDLLVKSGSSYAITSTKYNSQVVDMRKWFDYYLNITPILDASNDLIMIEAGDLASTVSKTQKNTDSNTTTIS